jgi:hypothetical protein
VALPLPAQACADAKGQSFSFERTAPLQLTARLSIKTAKGIGLDTPG